MNRLMQRLAYLETRLIPEGRGIVIFEDIHFEDSTEARIDLRPLRSADRLAMIIILESSQIRIEIASPAAP